MTMKRTTTLICLTLLAGVLVSCGTSPPVKYYSLGSGTAPPTADEAGATMLAFGPLRVPEYLNRTQMVTRGPGAELDVNEYARWAEPVEEAMHRVAAAHLDSALDGVIVVAYPYLQSLAVDYRLLGQVDRFDADASGNVVLQLQWTVLDKGNVALIPPRRDRYEARASNAADPGSVAGAMNQALDNFSKDVASQLRQAMAQ